MARMVVNAALVLLISQSLRLLTGAAAEERRFEAHLTTSNLDTPVVGATATGLATFTLYESNDGVTGATLDYTIQLFGLDFDPFNTETDDVSGLHLHHAPTGSAGPHVLNIFGRPRTDDADMNFDSDTGTVTGRWDDGDENIIPLDPLEPIGPNNIHPGSSRALTDFLAELRGEELFVVVHTWGQAGEPEIGGRIVAVPEPSALRTVCLAFVPLLMLGSRTKKIYQQTYQWEACWLNFFRLRVVRPVIRVFRESNEA